MEDSGGAEILTLTLVLVGPFLIPLFMAKYQEWKQLKPRKARHKKNQEGVYVKTRTFVIPQGFQGRSGIGKRVDEQIQNDDDGAQYAADSWEVDSYGDRQGNHRSH